MDSRKRDMTVQPELVDRLTGQSRPICVDCGAVFTREPDEVTARRGSGLPPSPRCPECRIARREARNARALDALRHGSLRLAQPVAPGSDDGADRLYPAVCSACQRPIRLPFKPRLDRPVYCRFCMASRSGR